MPEVNESMQNIFVGMLVLLTSDFLPPFIALLLNRARGLVIASEHPGNLLIQLPHLFGIPLRPIVVGVRCPKQRFRFSDLARAKAFQRLFGTGVSLGVFAVNEFG